MRISRAGKLLSSFDPPDTTDSAGQLIGGTPADVAVSPDGRSVAYSYYQGNCPPGASCGVRYVTLTGPSDRAGSPTDKTFRNEPSWFANDRLLVFGGYLRQVNIDTPGGYDDDRHWFDDKDLFGVEESEDLGDGDLSRALDRFVAVRAYGEKTHLMFYAVSGLDRAPAYACNTGFEPTLDSPTWSPDGQAVAFAHKEGVEVLTLPSVAPDCPGAGSGKVVLPGGSEPDWGPAAVGSAPSADQTPAANSDSTTVKPKPTSKPKPAAKRTSKAARRKAALKRCKRLRGKARSRCVRKVNRRFK